MLIELTLEFEKVRAVGNPRDDFAHVVRFFRVVRNQPEQFFDGVERFFPPTFG
ncbi:hypothetical protein D3C84_1281670 [compost metagenome]